MTVRELTSVERVLLSVMVAECGEQAVVSAIAAAQDENAKRAALASQVDALTARQRQTLAMYGAPLCYKRIAAAQGLELNTVKSNVQRVRSRLSLRNQSDAVRLVEQLGLRA